MDTSFAQVVSGLEGLHRVLVDGFQSFESTRRFIDDIWTSRLGEGTTSILSGGDIFEKAGVGFSSVCAEKLPPAASQRHQDLVGKPFRAAGVSLVFHPANPHVPTTHLNVRAFAVFDRTTENAQPIDWWVGGGFDLTPYYPIEEDCVLWHRSARDALGSQPDSFYREAKSACDSYFYLPHRGESRGIGGIFFDDTRLSDFDAGIHLLTDVVNAFATAYRTIVERRQSTTYTDAQRQFQLYRRGRYAEFNLVYDRGTLFGLQSGGRTESILMSLPPLVRWDYCYEPPPDSPEAALTRDFLQPRDWI